MLLVWSFANPVPKEVLEKAFSNFGKLERMKNVKDYAFIHSGECAGVLKGRQKWQRFRIENRIFLTDQM